MVVGDTAFLAAERDSRMRTSLAAAGGFFDQVVAISQRMMNVGLKNIFDKNKDVMSVFDGKNVYGEISADLDASQIKIPVTLADSFNVVWLWNFTGGTFTANLPGGEVKKYPVDGWSVAVLVPLVSQTLADDPNDDAATKQWKADRRKWIKDNFDVPGDYTPERLYAKMSDAHWNDIRFDRGSFKIDGKQTNWDSWKLIGNNASIADSFTMIMKQVCRDREKAGLTSAGFSFKFDANKPLDPKRATYPPLQLQHQSYPYNLPTSSGMTDPEWTKGVESLDVEPGPRNCLLYCELVDNRSLAGAQIPHVGNFTSIGNPQGVPKAIDGTFALSHQLFFERFLLPNLQPFVRQSQIYPQNPTFTNDGDTIRTSLGYVIGSNPDKDPTNDSTNSIYRFSLIPAQDAKPAFYQAHVEVTQDPLPPFASPSRGEWTKFYAEGSPTVTVSWETNGSKITVQGATEYKSHGTTASNDKVDPTLHQLTPANSWWHGWYSMSWTMHIDITPDNGSLAMKLSHDSNFVSVNAHPEDRKEWKWDDPNTPKDIQTQLQQGMETQLAHLEEVLNAGFQDQLKFTYPGNGQLKFGSTYFNQNGDLLAEINYGDLPNDRIVISRPVTLAPAPPSGGTVVICPGGNTPPPIPKGPRLAWVVNSPLKASKRPAAANEDTRVELRLTGTNKGTATVYFSKIGTVLDGHVSPSLALFNVLDFVTSSATASTSNVLVGVEMTPTPSASAPKVSPKLTVTKNSSRSFTCTVDIAAESGAIEVPAGGTLTITAKGVSGAAGTTSACSVREIWSDAKGVIASGDEAGMLAPLNVVLN